jgi:hypothetical protein
MSAATVISKVVTFAAIAVTAALSAIYGLLTGRIALMTVATGASTAAMVITGGASAAVTATLGIMSAASIVATGGFTALAAAIWTALSPLLPFIAAGAIIVGILAMLAAKAGILGPILKGLGSINLGKVFKDLGKGDFGKAWHDLTKGFKLPSLSRIWDNLTSDLPDLGKVLGGLWDNIPKPDLGKILGGLSKGISGIWSNLGLPKLDISKIVSGLSNGISGIWSNLGLPKLDISKIISGLSKGVSGIWSYISKPDFGRMFGGLKEWVGKIFSNINVGGIIQGITGRGPQEVLQIIADHLRVMLRWISANIAPVTTRIHAILKKLQSVFEWLYGLFQRFWNWIQQAMPGAAKETKRQEIDKTVSNLNEADRTKSLSFNRNTGTYSVKDLTVSSGTSHTLVEKDYGKEKYDKLTKKASEYAALPGFAEGIAQAVAKGISGIGETIGRYVADAIRDKLSLDIKFPESLTDLMGKINTTLTQLRTWLKDHGLTGSNVDTLNGGYESDEFTAAKQSNGNYNIIYKNPSLFGPSMEFDLTEEQVQEKLKGATNIKEVTPSQSPIPSGNNAEPRPTTKPEHGYRLKSNPEITITEDRYNKNLDDEQKSHWEPYAVGATFKRGGLFKGLVDDTEEITPKAITKRGPGPIAKALDLLNNATAAEFGRPAPASAGAGGDIIVHMPAQDFSGMKISSDVDFERILKDANKKAVADAVSEIKRMIGQDR